MRTFVGRKIAVQSADQLMNVGSVTKPVLARKRAACGIAVHDRGNADVFVHSVSIELHYFRLFKVLTGGTSNCTLGTACS